MSHTPGPWRIARWSDGLRVLMPSGVHVCSDVGHPDNREAQANARLIAAAPQMLDALRAAVVALAHASEGKPEYRKAYDEVDAAIWAAVSDSSPAQGTAE